VSNRVGFKLSLWFRMETAKRILLILVTVITCVGCDQTTKFIAKSCLPDAGTLSFFGDTVRLQLVRNQGAFLSLGASLPETWRRGLFLGGTGGILLTVLCYALFSKSASWSLTLAFALFLAGGVGNLVDRLMYGGYVVDFINIGIGRLRTGVFNVADIAIVAGAGVLFARMLRERQRVC
jgi:signal peptidase II